MSVIFAESSRHGGFNLLVTGDGKKALEIADQHTGKIDLLLSDVVMPEMSSVYLPRL
jgi:CheY-like chemotaxis protein